MDTQQIATFLDSIPPTSDTARYMLAVIRHAHAGRSPSWGAISMRALGSDVIIEVAVKLHYVRADRYVVLRWDLASLHIRMHSFTSLRSARTFARAAGCQGRGSAKGGRLVG